MRYVDVFHWFRDTRRLAGIPVHLTIICFSC